jgi:hypothetical protein
MIELSLRRTRQGRTTEWMYTIRSAEVPRPRKLDQLRIGDSATVKAVSVYDYWRKRKKLGKIGQGLRRARKVKSTTKTRRVGTDNGDIGAKLTMTYKSINGALNTVSSHDDRCIRDDLKAVIRIG